MDLRRIFDYEFHLPGIHSEVPQGVWGRALKTMECHHFIVMETPSVKWRCWGGVASSESVPHPTLLPTAWLGSGTLTRDLERI